MRRWDQPDLEAERLQFPGPVMGRRTGLHRHLARRQLGKERDEPAAREFAHDDDLALRVDGVNLKDLLRQIEPNPCDSGEIPDRLAHGRLPFRWVDDNDHLGTPMPFGALSTPSIPALKPRGSRSASSRKDRLSVASQFENLGD